MQYISNHLYTFYQHYADENQISVATAASKINRWDKQQWKQALSEQSMQDWPDEAKERTTVLGVLAGIDKAHLVGSIAGLAILGLGAKQHNVINDRINLDKNTEIRRMQQHFKLTSKQVEQIKQAKPIADSVRQSAGVGWSPSLWEQTDSMISDVQKMVDHAMKTNMQLEDVENLLAKHTNPKQFKPNQSINDRLEQLKFKTRRIVRSESAMAKNQINMATYKSQGAQLVDWVTEPSACDTCIDIAENGPYSIDNAPEPVSSSHPNCRCSLMIHEQTKGIDYF